MTNTLLITTIKIHHYLTKIVVMVRFPAGEVADSTLSLGEYIIYNIPLHILGEYVFFCNLHSVISRRGFLGDILIKGWLF